MKILRYNLLILLSVLMFSCYEDRSSLADQGYNEITVTFDASSDTVRAFIGDTLRINTTISTLEDSETTYSWEIGEYKSYTTGGVFYDATVYSHITSEKDLAYAHTALGTFRLRFVATNEDGSTIKILTFFVEAGYEEGFIVLGKDEDNNSTISYQLCQAGVDVGEPWQQECFLRSNGFALGDVESMVKSFTTLYVNSPNEQKLYSINTKTMLYQNEFDYSGLGEEFYGRDIYCNESTRSAATSVYIPNIGERGGVCTVQTNYVESVWSTSHADSLATIDFVWREDPWNSYLLFRINEDNRITAAWGKVIDYWRDLNYDLVNYFACEWDSQCLGVLSKDQSGNLIFNKMGQSGYNISGDLTAYNITADVILTSNSELINKDTKFFSNDYYSVVFFTNGDNKVYKWAYNQNQLPDEPFIVLPEGEEIQLLNSFPLFNYGGTPAMDLSELHIYTYNSSRADLKGSVYRYTALDGVQLHAYEGVCNRPVDAMYSIK